MKKTWAIIDGDILAYEAAAGCESAVNWGDDTDDGCRWVVTADEPHARATVRERVEAIMAAISATDVVMCLSDSTANWRKDVLPTYKSNRANVRRPIILPQVRQWVREEFAAWERPRLEGDDLLGILGGLRERFPGDRVMVTMDKDMSTLPGLHYRMHRPMLGVFEVSTKDADLWHLKQGIAGDPTDGYSGCPGMGMTTAEEFLADPYELFPEEFSTSRGRRAGETRTRWVKRAPSSMWAAIVSLYAKAGVSEADAIIQFQVARILRTTDYNFKTKEPILWTPANIS